MENRLYNELMAQRNEEYILNQTQINQLNVLTERLKEQMANMNGTIGGWTWPTTKTNNIVELEVVHEVDHELSRTDPAGIDRYLKAELARKLAQKMIDEDLITIYHDFDIAYNNDKFMAKVKLIQE